MPPPGAERRDSSIIPGPAPRRGARGRGLTHGGIGATRTGPKPDGKVLIGGAFTTLDNTNRTRIARLNADGRLDLSFQPGAGANGLVRAIALFPYMIPTIVAVILWKWLLNDTYGVVNYWLFALGIVRDPISWLGADHIMLSVIVMSVWQFFPFVLLSILARLQTIPPELYEAAKVDGASAVKRFLHVTLPQIRGILFVVILLRTIWMFTKFDTVYFDLTPQVALVVPHEEWKKYFEGKSANLVGRSVVARGWLTESKGRLHLRVPHPAMLTWRD